MIYGGCWSGCGRRSESGGFCPRGARCGAWVCLRGICGCGDDASSMLAELAADVDVACDDDNGALLKDSMQFID